MSKRALPAAVLLLLASCEDPNEATRQALAAADNEAAENGRVECAAPGASAFARVCTIERVQGPEGTTLVIHHPDGGFRRLLVTRDGRGVVAADGAEQAIVSLQSEDRIEVELAGYRYRLPATVKGERQQ